MLLFHASLHLLHHQMILLLSLHDWLLKCLIFVHILLQRKLILWLYEIWILIHIWSHRINLNTWILLLISIIFLCHRLTNHKFLLLTSQLINWIFINYFWCCLILILLQRSFCKIIFSMSKWAVITIFTFTVLLEKFANHSFVVLTSATVKIFFTSISA